MTLKLSGLDCFSGPHQCTLTLAACSSSKAAAAAAVRRVKPTLKRHVTFVSQRADKNESGVAAKDCSFYDMWLNSGVSSSQQIDNGLMVGNSQVIFEKAESSSLTLVGEFLNCTQFTQ